MDGERNVHISARVENVTAPGLAQSDCYNVYKAVWIFRA